MSGCPRPPQSSCFSKLRLCSGPADSWGTSCAGERTRLEQGGTAPAQQLRGLKPSAARNPGLSRVSSTRKRRSPRRMRAIKSLVRPVSVLGGAHTCGHPPESTAKFQEHTLAKGGRPRSENNRIQRFSHFCEAPRLSHSPEKDLSVSAFLSRRERKPWPASTATPARHLPPHPAPLVPTQPQGGLT